jgi:phytoene desaturase
VSRASEGLRGRGAAARHVAVVGGGFAGMAAALRLAASGARVTLLEREPRLGGKAGEWCDAGFRFDTGPSVLTLPDVVRSLFEDAGRDCPITFRPLAPLCRYVYPDGRRWDVYRDLDRTLAGLSPREGDVYRRALAKARELYEAAAPVFLRGPAPRPLRLAAYALRHGLAASPGRTLPDLLGSLGALAPPLGPFFLRFATYLGADPRRAPAVLHNVAWVEVGLGIHHPVGGIYALVRALAAALDELGVEVRAGETVERLVVRGGAVREVVTTREVMGCDALVAAADRDLVLDWLGRRRREREASLSGLVLLAGIRGVDERLAHHTIAFPERYGSEFDAIAAGRHPPDPTLYLSVSARSEPADAPAGSENRFVMANAPALPVARETDERREARAEEGRRALLAGLERRGFAWPPAALVTSRWLDPTAFAAFGHRGRLYGHAPHGLLGALRPGPRLAGIGNLALAGGSVHPGGGVPLALLSGAAAAAVIAAGLDGRGSWPRARRRGGARG